MPRVVAFTPHPDDESYALAGTLAHLVARGWDARVVCLTRGEAGVDHAGRGRDLGAVREAELRASCAILGAEAVVLDLPDGGVSGRSIDLSPHAAGAELVLTLGEDGGYGHPDHLACTRLVGAASFDATLLHAAFPKGLFAPVHRAIRRFVKLEVTAAELGVDRDAVDHALDVRPYRESKLASVAAHRSQRPTDDPRSFLIDGWIDGLLDEELWTHARGPAFRFPT